MGNTETIVAYTGIGAREAPAAIIGMLEKTGKHMASKGYLLRSGGADGASAAFERGCDMAGGRKEIFLPWRGFNGNNSSLYAVSERAMSIASAFNPAWVTLAESAKKCQARYAHVIMGADMKKPSVCVICYTAGGKQKGGTGQALKIAQKFHVPVFDLGAFDETPDILNVKLVEFLTGLSLDAAGLEI
ncbi:MAG: hypothetical protein MUC76_08115 [Spirochaetes bacterium]|nr:hypothetical protein [Spirochaetota bacterium]